MNKNKFKNIVKILLLTLILIIIAFFINNAINHSVEQSRFTKLDNQMEKLLLNLRAVSGSTDSWDSKSNCEPELSGPWPTGSYICNMEITTSKLANSSNDVNDFFIKYYPIINGSDIFKSRSELDTQPLNYFGKNFIVSSAQQKYTEASTGIGCDYLVSLSQIQENITLTSDSSGSEIIGGVGNLKLSIKCTSKSNSDWLIK